MPTLGPDGCRLSKHVEQAQYQLLGAYLGAFLSERQSYLASLRWISKMCVRNAPGELRFRTLEQLVSRRVSLPPEVGNLASLQLSINLLQWALHFDDAAFGDDVFSATRWFSRARNALP